MNTPKRLKDINGIDLIFNSTKICFYSDPKVKTEDCLVTLTQFNHNTNFAEALIVKGKEKGKKIYIPIDDFCYLNAKVYKIKTLQDIARFTNEDNIDNFLKDLKSSLSMYWPINEIAKICGEELKFPEMDWIDDNEHKINLTVGTNESAKT